MHQIKERVGKNCSYLEIANFALMIESSKERKSILDSEIQPVKDFFRLKETEFEEEKAAVAKTAAIKLNGGLSTTMGIDFPKCLIDISGETKIIDVCFENILSLRRKYEENVPLSLMSSFHTYKKTDEYCSKAWPGFLFDNIVQSKFPRLTESFDLFEVDGKVSYYPPGHGNLFLTVFKDGYLEDLFQHGYEVLFVSNIDNTRATVSPDIAANFLESGLDMLVEVVERTGRDRKGGHPFEYRSSGKKSIRELYQSVEGDRFQDIDFFDTFNTNNIWFRIESVLNLLEKNNGVLDLPVIQNFKKIDGKQCIQLETAIGSISSLLDNVDFVKVSRERFAPIKTFEDLERTREEYERRKNENRARLRENL